MYFYFMFSGKTIFYGALDWGLGHATRSVPIIKRLLKNNTVILGFTPLTQLVLDDEFPELTKVVLPAYDIKYSKILPLWFKLGLSAPRISAVIKAENEALKTIIENHAVDIIISDNRFGLYSEKIHSVFITHQLFLKTPVFENSASKINQNFIRRFHEVWVPDYEHEAESLSGELSHGKHFHKNVKYIGPQSRLADVIATTEGDTYDYLVLLSGPEPSRTELEKKVFEKVISSGKKTAFIKGSGLGVSGSERETIKLFDLPRKDELKKLILSSEKIICRSGYSTLMDMHLLGKKELILIPTPGQTEQEYLAAYWKKKFGAEILPQNKISTFIL